MVVETDADCDYRGEWVSCGSAPKKLVHARQQEQDAASKNDRSIPMAEIRLPLIPLGPYNILFQYGQGRLFAPAPDAQTLIIAMPPDGVFLQTLRVRDFLHDA